MGYSNVVSRRQLDGNLTTACGSFVSFMHCVQYTYAQLVAGAVVVPPLVGMRMCFVTLALRVVGGHNGRCFRLTDGTSNVQPGVTLAEGRGLHIEFVDEPNGGEWVLPGGEPDSASVVSMCLNYGYR